MATTTVTLLFLSLFLLFLLNTVAQAKVSPSETFTYVNHGELGPYATEYNADYRALPAYASPFQLCFYNTTPDAYYLAIRMGTLRSESRFRWVWEANRGLPVRENATFSLHADGDLVLADADRRVVWSTGTANKGVAGFNLLPNGNMVLYDARGRFVWQSFDHPTDTLMVGQSLRESGPSQLVSRTSSVEGSNGIYSLVIDPRGVGMYITSKVRNTKPLPYYNFPNGKIGVSGALESMELVCERQSGGRYQVSLLISAKLGSFPTTATRVLATTKYNSTLAFVRLQTDGNLVLYTYDDVVDYMPWAQPFTFFSAETGMASGCALPSKCGPLGLCAGERCMACPSSKGLLGWSKGCRPPRLGACKGRGAVDYYKVAGAESFLTSSVNGAKGVRMEECKRRCSVDCGCLGFMYWEESSTCWLAPLLGTLTKVSTTSHLAYIKYLH